MALYRCYFRGVNGRFSSRQDFLANADDEAIAEAHRLYTAEEAQAGFELWTGARLIIAEPVRRE